jgi:hypothetical protein
MRITWDVHVMGGGFYGLFHAVFAHSSSCRQSRLFARVLEQDQHRQQFGPQQMEK